MYARNRSVTPVPFTIRPKKTQTPCIRDRSKSNSSPRPPSSHLMMEICFSPHASRLCCDAVCAMNVRKFVSCYQQRLLSVHDYQKVLAVPEMELLIDTSNFRFSSAFSKPGNERCSEHAPLAIIE